MDDNNSTIEELVSDVDPGTSVLYQLDANLSEHTFVIDRYSNSSDNGSIDTISENMSPQKTDSLTYSVSEEILGTGFDNNVKCTFIAQETFTQTSKTIIELAEHDGAVRKATDTKTLETQTSLISITEKQTIQYMLGSVHNHSSHSRGKFKEILDSNRITVKPGYSIFRDNVGSPRNVSPARDDSLRLAVSDYDIDINSGDEGHAICAAPATECGKINQKTMQQEGEDYAFSSQIDTSFSSDFEEDSLMTGRDKESTESDIKNLSRNLVDYEVMPTPDIDKADGLDLKKLNILSPLNEECRSKNTEPTHVNYTDTSSEDNKPLDAGNEAKLTADSDKTVYCKSTIMNLRMDHTPKRNNSEPLKLPPINNVSCPNSPHLNSLFTNVNKPNLYKPTTVNNLYKASMELESQERQEPLRNNLASGEGTQVTDGCEKAKKEPSLQLPPIHAEGNSLYSKAFEVTTPFEVKVKVSQEHPETISIREKIKELKASSYPHSRHKIPLERSWSPCKSQGSGTSTTESKLNEIAERGCDALCVEMLRRLHSASWIEVMETLDDMPRMLEKFWCTISEQRIADILRQICQAAESPRIQVARSACKTMSAIVKITNYTKKPEFYECMSMLLSKTGSYSRPLRRAANLALDEIVCSVDLSHSVTAICLHGACHKSAQVRCATARLLVVCCALGSGGRDLLRTRPVSTVTARRFVIRALSMMLEDRNSDVRKYAERLYSMLRPLPNFEAFFLTDLEIDVATTLMKRYDKMLLCGPPKDAS